MKDVSPGRNHIFWMLLVLIATFAIIDIDASFSVDAGAQSAARVEIFVTSWCPYCQALERYLKSNQIPYMRQDIEKSETAKRIHQQLGGGGVPVIRIDGTTVIHGFDPGAIDEALKHPRQKLGVI